MFLKNDGAKTVGTLYGDIHLPGKSQILLERKGMELLLTVLQGRAQLHRELSPGSLDLIPAGFSVVVGPLLPQEVSLTVPAAYDLRETIAAVGEIRPLDVSRLHTEIQLWQESLGEPRLFTSIVYQKSALRAIASAREQEAARVRAQMKLEEENRQLRSLFRSRAGYF